MTSLATAQNSTPLGCTTTLLTSPGTNGTPVGCTTTLTSPGTNGTTSTAGTEELLMSPINNTKLAQLLTTVKKNGTAIKVATAAAKKNFMKSMKKLLV